MAASFSVKLLICWTTFLWSCGIQVGYSQYNVYRQDPFAILSRTLLTYQQAACDGQVLNLVCPTSTKISIQLVQYGRTAPSSQVKKFVAEVCSYPVGINRVAQNFKHYKSISKKGTFEEFRIKLEFRFKTILIRQPLILFCWNNAIIFQGSLMNPGDLERAKVERIFLFFWFLSQQCI